MSSEIAPDGPREEEVGTSRHRGRAITSVTLIVLASILLPLAGLTVWTRNLMLNTDRYVETVAPLAQDPQIQAAITNRVSTDLVERLDIDQRAADALPAKAKFLAPAIATGAQNLTARLTAKALTTSQFDSIWRFANERAHGQLVDALTGRNGKHVTTEQGKVVLNLGPLAVKVAQQLAKVGVKTPSNVSIERQNLRFVLIDSADLASVQSYVKLLDQLAWVLPILALLLYGAAIAIAPRRRKAVLRTGIGIAVAMAVAVLGYNLLRTVYLDSLPSTVQSPAAAAAVFDTLTRFLQRGLRILLLVGLVTAAIATLAGPSRGAVAIRGNWNRMFGKAGTATEDQPGPVRAWFAHSLKGLRIAILVIVLLVLVIWPRPTGVVFLWTAIFAVVALAVVQFVGSGGQPADADPDVVPTAAKD
jgi:hypothetical protein